MDDNLQGLKREYAAQKSAGGLARIIHESRRAGSNFHDFLGDIIDYRHDLNVRSELRGLLGMTVYAANDCEPQCDLCGNHLALAESDGQQLVSAALFYFNVLMTRQPYGFEESIMLRERMFSRAGKDSIIVTRGSPRPMNYDHYAKTYKGCADEPIVTRLALEGESMEETLVKRSFIDSIFGPMARFVQCEGEVDPRPYRSTAIEIVGGSGSFIWSFQEDTDGANLCLDLQNRNQAYFFPQMSISARIYTIDNIVHSLLGAPEESKPA